MDLATFDRARTFLASRGFARNLRVQDVVASRDYAASATAPNLYWHSYTGAGAAPGPLDANGNLPTSAAAFAVGAGVYLPRGVVGDTDDVAALLEELGALAQHVVRVAGTDILSISAGRTIVAPGSRLMYTTGADVGVAAGERVSTVPTPPLYIGPGERVQQGLLLTDTVTPGAASPVMLGLELVVADEGTD